MTNEEIQPKVREVWSLCPSNEGSFKVLVLDSKNNGELFVSAKITFEELPKNYNGLNRQIWSDCNVRMISPCIAHMDALSLLNRKWFNTNLGRLSDNNWQKILEVYQVLNKQNLEI